MYTTRQTPFHYFDVVSAIVIFIMGRLAGQVLDRYNILTLDQITDTSNKLSVIIYACSVRMDRILMIWSLNFGLYRLAGTFANGMKADFYFLIHRVIKNNPDFKTIGELIDDKSNRYWAKILQLDKLVKNPVDAFLLFYPLTKQ